MPAESVHKVPWAGIANAPEGVDPRSKARGCIRCGAKIRMETAPICDRCAAEVMSAKRRGNIFVSFFFNISVLVFVYLYFFRGLMVLWNFVR